MIMWYTYILTLLGCTFNIGKRPIEHNHGKVLSTKSRMPLELIYQENFEDKYEAFNKER